MHHTEAEVPEEKKVDKTIFKLVQQKLTLRAFPFWWGVREGRGHFHKDTHRHFHGQPFQVVANEETYNRFST